MPNGYVIEQYHVADFGRGAVAVIVADDRGDVLMERVVRYPTQCVSWELPAGGLEEGETALEAARREVLEETGYETNAHTHLYTYHPLNGISNSEVHIVRCRIGQRQGNIDENEIQGVRWFTPSELREAIQRREVTDGLALTGLLLHFV